MSADSSSTHPLAERLRRWTVVAFQLLVILVPFFFTWVNEELFELNKMLLTYGFTAVITALWIGRMVVEGRVLFRRTWMDIPLGLFFVSQVLSTLFSIHPYTSIFGFYTRFNGGLLSTFCYVALLYAALNSFTKKDIRAVVTALLVGGLGSALYAIPEHFGHSPSCFLITGGRAFNASCWIQDVQNRIFGTFGQPNWLAAYAIGLWPVAAVWWIQSKLPTTSDTARTTTPATTWFLLSVLGSLLLTLLYTKSRSGLLGFLVGLAVLGAGVMVMYGKGRQLPASIFKQLGLLCLGVVSIIAIVGSPYTPSLASLVSHQTPSSGTSSETAGPALESGGTESGEIRKIVWQGAVAIWKRYPLLGSGVETFAYSYYQDRPAAHNMVSEWDFLYNKAHNEFLQLLATTGLVGLATYLIFLSYFVVRVTSTVYDQNSKISSHDKLLLIGVVAGIAAMTFSNVLGFSTVMINVVMYLYIGVGILLTIPALSLPKINTSQPVSNLTKIWLGVIGLLLLVSIWTICNWWLADYDFATGKRLLGAGQTSAGIDRYLSAIARRPREALFYDELSVTYAQIAVVYHRQQEATAAEQLAEAALLASDQTLALNDQHLNFYKNRSRVFVLLSEIKSNYLQQAQETLAFATTLAPTDAKLLYNLAVLDAAIGDEETALKRLQATIQLKPNYQDAYLELARIYEGRQELPAALEQYKIIQRTLAPNDPVIATSITRLEASIAAQKKP